MLLLFAITLFLGAALLFWVQPLFARMVLPLLGGTPQVWNTCMVFFQAALLAGYAYAHVAPSWLGVRRHAVLHLGLLLLALTVLPILVPAPPPDTAIPALWLLGQLLVGVGVPFFVVATTAPLLQRWFAGTGHPAAHDPYFLYAASNLGSVVALLSYPVLLEPTLRLGEQSRLWLLGYVALIALTFVCAVLLWRTRPATDAPPPALLPPLATRHSPLAARLRWVLLALVPSSLMLSVTTYLTTDVAAIPLLWVVPLALYLLTFILTFARRPPIPQRVVARVMPLVVLLLTLVLLSEATETAVGPVWLLLVLHLLGLFVIALFCHGELARDRPAPQHLTEFYLWMSVGGVLGGLFNALLAPLLFRSVLEYPLALIGACLLRGVHRPEDPVHETGVDVGATGSVLRTRAARSHTGSEYRTRGTQPPKQEPAPPSVLNRLDLLIPLALGLLTASLVLTAQAWGMPAGPAGLGLMFGFPAVVCYTLLERPLRFGLGIAALLLAGSLYEGVHGRVEYRSRSFFGVHKVTLDPDGGYRQLVHGNTVHGRQSLDRERRREPLTYYHRTGPIGQLFETLSEADRAPQRVAVVGLGAGSLAAYGQAGQEWTFYEIDPEVVYIARDSGYFTYLRDCQAALEYRLGDARLRLAQDEGRHYDVLVIDAFNSDALPIHLLTREALQVYLQRLTATGVLAFHISSRYLDLEPVLAELAADAGLLGLARDDISLTPEERRAGKSPSRWVLMGPEASPLGELVSSVAWRRLQANGKQPLWTDDFANPFQVLK